MKRFTKRIMAWCRCATRSFLGQGERGTGVGGVFGGAEWGWFCKQGTLINIFSQKHKKKRPRIETFWSVSPRYSCSYILNGKCNPKMDTIRAFLSKVITFFLIFKTGQRRPPPPRHSCMPVNVAEYASVSLNISKYPCKCLNKQLF